MAPRRQTLESEAFAVLEASYVFGVAPHDKLARLAALARLEHFETDATVCTAGQFPDALRYVRTGAIRPVRVTSSGVAASLVPLVAGVWATWPAVFCSDPVPHDLVADAGTSCLKFPKRAVVELADETPQLYKRVIDEISRTLRGLMTLILTTGAANDERALAQAVLAACRAFGEGEKRGVTLDMTQEQIGRLGFGSRQRVAALLKKLSEAGVVASRYGRLEVPDVRKLEAWLGEDAGV